MSTRKSFVSREAVKAGVWGAALTALTVTVGQNTSRIAAAEADIDGSTAAITTLSGRVTALDTTLAANDGRIDDLDFSINLARDVSLPDLCCRGAHCHRQKQDRQQNRFHRFSLPRPARIATG